MILNEICQKVRSARQWWYSMAIAATWRDSFRINKLTPTLHSFVKVFVESHPWLHLLERSNRNVLSSLLDRIIPLMLRALPLWRHLLITIFLRLLSVFAHLSFVLFFIISSFVRLLTLPSILQLCILLLPLISRRILTILFIQRHCRSLLVLPI